MNLYYSYIRRGLRGVFETKTGLLIAYIILLSFSGISVSDEILSQSNPLFVISHSE